MRLDKMNSKVPSNLDSSMILEVLKEIWIFYVVITDACQTLQGQQNSEYAEAWEGY